MVQFAINHMAIPGHSAAALLELSVDLGCVGVELRNDLGTPLFDGAAPETLADRASTAGQRVLALAEIKAFNDFTDQTLEAAQTLVAQAVAVGAEGVSLIPRNDGQRCTPEARRTDLRVALAALLPVIREAGLFGFIEPLGFDTCPLRHKADAIDAIEAVGGADTYRLVHDTFHHALAQDSGLFPDWTGIVHISGVTDPALGLDAMRDPHRGLVDAEDRLGTIAQLRDLGAGGFAGPVSFEPFAPEIHALTAPGPALRHSMEFIAGQLAREAA